VHPDYAGIKPRYQLLAAYCNGCTEEAWDHWMQDLDRTVAQHNPEAELVFPLADIKRNSRTGTFAGRPPYYLELGAPAEELLERGIDLSRPVLAPQSIPVLALQFALALGVKEIYLLGCDHDWLLHMHQGSHFYREDQHAIRTNREWEGADVESECRNYVVLWQQYKLLRHLAVQAGVAIVNATEGGMLDVFPRRKLAEVLAAPAAAPGAWRHPGEYGFFGDFASWSQAQGECEGYDAPQILEKVSQAIVQVKRGEAAYERDSVLFDAIPYPWIAPLAEWLPRLAERYGNRLDLIDFGGSLGSSYFALKAALSGLESLSWSVVEQGHFVDRGNELVADQTLRFYHSIEACLKERAAKVVLLSSVIQYLEEPYRFLEGLLAHGFDYLIFDRTPFIEGARDRLTVQHVPPEIYPASYPAWFFSVERFFAPFEGRYRMIAQFDALDGANIRASYKGVILERIKEVPHD